MKYKAQKIRISQFKFNYSKKIFIATNSIDWQIYDNKNLENAVWLWKQQVQLRSNLVLLYYN